MLTAYFDDSGAFVEPGSPHNTQAQVFCGLVSTVDQWLRFDEDWRSVLRMPQFDLEHLHMKELRNGKGRFAKFKDNRDLQAELFDRLQRIMRIRALETFGGTVVLKDFDAVNAEYAALEELGPPIVMAGQVAIVKMMDWCEKTFPGVPVRIVVDQGMKHYGVLDDRTYEHYGLRLGPGNVKDTPALQASDHVAWELHRAMSGFSDGMLPQLSKARGSMRALMRRFSRNMAGATMDNWFVCDDSEMRRVFNLNGISRRT